MASATVYSTQYVGLYALGVCCMALPCGSMAPLELQPLTTYRSDHIYVDVPDCSALYTCIVYYATYAHVPVRASTCLSTPRTRIRGVSPKYPTYANTCEYVTSEVTYSTSEYVGHVFPGCLLLLRLRQHTVQAPGLCQAASEAEEERPRL